MSGKHLLDAIALLGASRSIVIRHARIRAQQFELYGKTSSISKALAGTQRDRQKSDLGKTRDSAVPTGIDQDHHYNQSTENEVQDPVPKDSLEVQQKQAERYPLPDGSIPPKDSSILPEQPNDEIQITRDSGLRIDPLATEASADSASLKPKSSGESTIPDPTAEHGAKSNEEARKLQRQSEAQIPSQPAEPPARSDLMPEDESEQDEPAIFVDQERDTYYQPPGTSSPVLSALPRVKLPKKSVDEQGGDSHLPQGLNPDTFYSNKNYSGEQAVEEEFSEEQLQALFHSPRAKKLLSKSGKSGYTPGGVGPKDARGLHTWTRTQQRMAFSNARQLSEKTRTSHEVEDLKNLAADIAKDVDVASKQILGRQ